MTNVATLAARYAGRPLLLAPLAAEDLARRIQAVDARAFERPGRLSAFLRRVGLSGQGGREVHAWDDDDYTPPPLEERLAYAPRWLGAVEDTGYCWSLKSGVALMCCDTPLVERGEEFCGLVYHGYDTLLLAMREAEADERVKAIFLRLDCPGGVVGGGLEELAQAMREIRAAAGGKPIWVFADMACSAAYWIAAQADRIIAPSVGYVGSIGAVIVHTSHAGALAEAGIEVTAIQFGRLKTDGAWWERLSESARASWQADVDQCGRNFIAAVTAGRPQLTSDVLLGTEAQVFMAEHDEAGRSGLALGFVDAISGEEAAFNELVALVSEPAPEPNGNPAPDAVGSRAAATPKEAPMAQAAQPKKADTSARRAELQAQLAALDAEENGGGADDAGDEKKDDEKPKGEDAPQGGDEQSAGQSDAAAISGSAEAKSHPQLALAAIQTGMTLVQFQASVRAGAASPKASRLDTLMAGQKRLGPDASKPEGGQRNGFAAAMAARAEANRTGQVKA